VRQLGYIFSEIYFLPNIDLILPKKPSGFGGSSIGAGWNDWVFVTVSVAGGWNVAGSVGGVGVETGG
jgi:hypothetical protein